MTKFRNKLITKISIGISVMALMLSTTVVSAFANESTVDTTAVLTNGPDAIWNEGSGSSENGGISTYSWYSSSGEFKVALATPTRYFDGTNVGFNLEGHNSNPNHMNTTYTVRLFRVGSGYVSGKITLDREGSNSVNWTNVGPGNYQFHFEKANDGTTQYIDYIEMFSW